MNKPDARKIAEFITNEQILDMFNLAKENVKDWAKVSNCNKGITKGVAWNILAENFDPNVNHHIAAKTNFVREFGEFLPDNLKIKKEKRVPIVPVHFDPLFIKRNNDGQ